MNETAPVVIEPLGSHHDRAAFSCGVDALDRYLREQASQDERRNVARVFVAVGDEPHVVAGYYTLSSLSIDVGDLPAGTAKKLPRYPQLPAALIGRLAVTISYQGKRLGEMLLVDALKRIIEHGDTVACYAVVVDAIDERAASFYEKYGFQRFPSRPKRLFLPIATAGQLF
jgi:ribosomal protein S18 acetylase RimI-like enzyme